MGFTVWVIMVTLFFIYQRLGRIATALEERNERS